MKIREATPEAIEEVAEIILEGGVGVIPTETVYGLACNAYDEEAVRRVYEIKGRPLENPLIVHVADVESLDGVVEQESELLTRLAHRFWPGPLTLVVAKNPEIPDVTTAGLETVAVRVPMHPVAQELILWAGCPIAAPSANPFMGLSPTTAGAIDPSIAEKVDFILDGGRCEFGLESTVVDLSGDAPRLLRPGAISRAQIQATIGEPLGQAPPKSVRNSPGMYARHYAPAARVELVEKLKESQSGLTFEDAVHKGQIHMPRHPAAYGANLYEALHRLDAQGPETIYVESPPESEEWEAIRDRLAKASG